MLSRVELAEKGVEFRRHPSFLLFQVHILLLESMKGLALGNRMPRLCFWGGSWPAAFPGYALLLMYRNMHHPPLEGNRIHLLIL